MAEKDKIAEKKVKHDGIFNFKETYGFLHTLLTDLGYAVEEKGYGEKTKPEGKEIDVHWVAKRKISDYFRFILKIDWLVHMTPVEVVRDGVKIKANKGDIEIKIIGFLERDYEHKWEATAFLRFLRGVYDRYIIKTTIEGYAEDLISDVNEMTNQLKAFLVLEAKR